VDTQLDAAIGWRGESGKSDNCHGNGGSIRLRLSSHANDGVAALKPQFDAAAQARALTPCLFT